MFDIVDTAILEIALTHPFRAATEFLLRNPVETPVGGLTPSLITDRA
jgi:hypothetical protein